MKSQLMKITTKNNLDETIEKIINLYHHKIILNKVYVLQNEK